MQGSWSINCRNPRPYLTTRRSAARNKCAVTSMRVALGVCGGVAAYKAAELVRRLQQEGMDVQVVMTHSAQEFVTPLTFAGGHR